MPPFDFLIILAACRSMSQHAIYKWQPFGETAPESAAQYAAIECRKRKWVDEDQKQKGKGKVKVKEKGNGTMTCNVTPLPLPSTDAV